MLLSKYCASGNDFLILHGFKADNRGELALSLCDRFYGIGADGLVVLLPPPAGNEEVAYQWEFYNSDGSVANMCGNASRAVSLYAYHNKIAKSKHSFLSKAGVISTEIKEIIGPKEAYIQSKLGPYSMLGNYVEGRKGNLYECDLVLMAVPHLVCFAPSLRDYQEIVADTDFLANLRQKYDANISIAFQGMDGTYYATYERGVEAITKACGTGASAVYVAAGDLSSERTLIPPSKEILKISHKDGAIYCSGLAKKICDCVVD